MLTSNLQTKCNDRGAPSARSRLTYLLLNCHLSLFTKLDRNSGILAGTLAKESRFLTMFITPYGQYFFNKLPFGITSTPKHFYHQMNNILSDLPGVVCRVDDTLVSGRDEQEHDQCLHAVLKKL